MTQKLLIIRGNSGSGKTTIAQAVRARWDGKVMFLQQDVLRRDILKVEDKAGNPVIGLIEQLVAYGKQQGYDIIIEGIFANAKYGELLRRLVVEFEESHVYYLDVPFEETLRRHNNRAVSSEFGEKEMREWWLEKDYLNIPSEKVIDHGLSEQAIIERIIREVLL